MIKRKIKNFLGKFMNEDMKDYLRIRKSKFFNGLWYKRMYHVKGDAAWHYLKKGYKLGYFPSNRFNSIKYVLQFDEVRVKDMNPIVHFERYGKWITPFEFAQYIDPKDAKETKAAIKLQDEMIKKEYDPNIENLTVFFVPEIDFVGGGVMSINSIAKVIRDHKDLHNSEVIVCTVPGPRTFFEYTKFKADFHIYRYEQLMKYFKNLKNVTLHIPEIYYHHILTIGKPSEIEWIKRIPHCTINILNQNNDYMPRPQEVEMLSKYVEKLTITCAHKKYCTKQLRSSYNCSVHLFSASNLKKYNYINFEKKKDLIVYSIDQHPMKSQIIDKLKKELPNFELKEIKDMKYSEYLNIIGQAKFMITFGEGLDGYFVESIRSGTMAFSVYNLRFFDPIYEDLDNVYASYNDEFDNIVKDINYYCKHPDKYKKVVDIALEIDKKQYDDKEYIANIEKYLKGEYTYDINDVINERNKRISEQPLISIAVATYNGEKYLKKQIDSLLSLNYSNYEIIVSDDNSNDDTLNILKKYGNKIKVYKNSDKTSGLNGNFINAIKHCNGEYIALCDQDDIWKPNKLDVLLERIDDFDIVFSSVTVIDENDEYHHIGFMHSEYEKCVTNYLNFSDHFKSNEILGCTCLIRRDFLFDNLDIPDDVIYHDWWFVLSACKNGKGILFLDKDLIFYRQHNSNTAKTTYNSSNWFSRKLLFNKVIRKDFTLSKFEKELLDIDDNYNLLMNIFRKYMPSDICNYFLNNYYYCTDQLVEDLGKIKVDSEEK